MEPTLTPRDYVAIMRWRKWSFIVPALLLLALASAAALLWPPTYRSSATVLIEEAEIPEDLADLTATDYVERRLEAITRRVLVTDNLIGIIERFGLYTAERTAQPITEIVETMREDIHVDTISADIVDPQTGRKGEATVAFEVAFDYQNAETSQRVTNELVSLYLNENIRQRRQRVADTATFLTRERERIETRIAEISNELTAFKTENNGALPEQLVYNQQLMARAEADMRDLERQAQSLRDRETYLAAQLAQIEPNRTYAGGAQAYMTPGSQLEAARAQLSTLTARYGPSHPDVVAARRELAALQQTTGSSSGTSALALERDRLAAELDTLRQRYSEEHPDVRRASRQLATIEESLRNSPRGTGGRQAIVADNPAYLAIQAQLEGVRAQLAAIQPTIAQIEERYRQYQELTIQAPVVEQEYSRITRQLDDAIAQRDELLLKEQAARLGQAIETEQKAERFSLIEPPDLPTEPERPNRPLILLVGLMLAMGGGVGSVALRHALDETVTGPGDVTAIIGIEPLGIVPHIRTRAERRRRIASGFLLAVVILSAIAAAAWYVHTAVMPLDTALFAVSRKFFEILAPYLPLPPA